MAARAPSTSILEKPSEEEGKSEKEVEEIVTIGLYYQEASSNIPDKLIKFITQEIGRIEHIRKKITEAATIVSKRPPKFILSVLLVPDWSRACNSYEDAAYNEARTEFVTKFTEQMEKMAEGGFELQDAYKSTSDHEKCYLNGLKNMGANADWIKTHAIITNYNVKHLQLDSNTQIDNYLEFYKATFGQESHDALHMGERDALNASAYDNNTNYVSAHNKVVYTMPNGKIVTALKSSFLDYCKWHQAPDDPDKDKNAIYSQVFCPVLNDIGLTKITERTVKEKEVLVSKKRYLVDFNCPEYSLTRHIITAVNMSWSASGEADPYADIKNVPALPFKEAQITFPCFLNLVNVHTGEFGWHEQVYSSTEKYHDALNKFRNTLHHRKKDIEIITRYYVYIADKHAILIESLVDVFPSTPIGTAFCVEVFGCDKTTLRDNPVNPEILKRLKDSYEEAKERKEKAFHAP